MTTPEHRIHAAICLQLKAYRAACREARRRGEKPPAWEPGAVPPPVFRPMTAQERKEWLDYLERYSPAD